MSPIASTLLHLRSAYPTLRPAERRVADTILENPDDVIHLSITDLAAEAGVSDATIVKFCKRLGYKGFQEFKILLAQDVVTKQVPIYGEIELDDDVETIKEKIFQANITALQDTAQVLKASVLETAAKALADAGEIHFYGMGASGIVALDAEHKFSRIGLRVGAFVDAHTQLTRAALLEPGDAAVGISYSGDTLEIVEALEAARLAGALTIAITNYPQSTVAAAGDLVLLTASQEDILRSGVISSRVAQLSVIDSLFIAVALVNFVRSKESIERTKKVLSRHRMAQRRA
ncbi:MAG: MurR/RpiR family transcriptional regulator [Bacillota bacterium]|nr:MurR/RpiR family transcriptional regulator [Bacillota bacterium]HHT90618.1 MurR/RpiR family transcriptional regulator [Bacillota bacterium]